MTTTYPPRNPPTLFLRTLSEVAALLERLFHRRPWHSFFWFNICPRRHSLNCWTPLQLSFISVFGPFCAIPIFPFISLLIFLCRTVGTSDGHAARLRVSQIYDNRVIKVIARCLRTMAVKSLRYLSQCQVPMRINPSFHYTHHDVVSIRFVVWHSAHSSKSRSTCRQLKLQCVCIGVSVISIKRI